MAERSLDLGALQSLLERVHDLKVACVGDLMLDRYVYGEVSRISPEAPIPVLRARRTVAMPGGVGNVARNVAALGGQARLGAVAGDDAVEAVFFPLEEALQRVDWSETRRIIRQAHAMATDRRADGLVIVNEPDSVARGQDDR